MRICCLIIVCTIWSCQSNPKDLPVLSYTIDASGKPEYYSITYEGFFNQLGDSFSTETIKNKVFIANFFFTRCPSICPPMRTELIKIANEFSDESNFMIISHTIDPEHDTVVLLKNYADRTEIPPKTWQFLRASESHSKLQAKQYMTNFKPNEDGTDFYHSSYVALVDKQQHIRGFYNILVPEEVKRLKNDIQILLN